MRLHQLPGNGISSIGDTSPPTAQLRNTTLTGRCRMRRRSSSMQIPTWNTATRLRSQTANGHSGFAVGSSSARRFWTAAWTSRWGARHTGRTYARDPHRPNQRGTPQTSRPSSRASRLTDVASRQSKSMWRERLPWWVFGVPPIGLPL